MTATIDRGLSFRVRLRFPYTRPPRGLSGNPNVNPLVQSRDRLRVLTDVAEYGRNARLHRYQPGEIEHVTMQLVWAPGDDRPRNADHLDAMTDVIASALWRTHNGGLGLIPDSTLEYLTRLRPLILAPPAPKAMFCDLWLKLGNPYGTDGDSTNAA